METVKRTALAALRAYKSFISPLLPPACRFHPTCSCYMYEAIAQHGTACGVYLGVRRILRCHPFHPGGYDPVPDRVADVDKLFARFQAVKRHR